MQQKFLVRLPARLRPVGDCAPKDRAYSSEREDQVFNVGLKQCRQPCDRRLVSIPLQDLCCAEYHCVLLGIQDVLQNVGRIIFFKILFEYRFSGFNQRVAILEVDGLELAFALHLHQFLKVFG